MYYRGIPDDDGHRYIIWMRQSNGKDHMYYWTCSLDHALFIKADENRRQREMGNGRLGKTWFWVQVKD